MSGASDGKESACNAGHPGSIPGLGRFLWRREWKPAPVLLPGEFHGQRSLEGYSPWGGKESDTTEWLTHIHIGPLPQTTSLKLSWNWKALGHCTWLCRHLCAQRNYLHSCWNSAHPLVPKPWRGEVISLRRVNFSILQKAALWASTVSV